MSRCRHRPLLLGAYFQLSRPTPSPLPDLPGAGVARGSFTADGARPLLQSYRVRSPLTSTDR